MQAFLVLAGLSEAVTQVVIQIIEGIQKKNEDWWKMPLACVFASVLLFLGGLNVFRILGVPLVFGSELAQLGVAAVVGGILVGRWGATINDVLSGLQGLSAKAKAEGDIAEAQAPK